MDNVGKPALMGTDNKVKAVFFVRMVVKYVILHNVLNVSLLRSSMMVLVYLIAHNYQLHPNIFQNFKILVFLVPAIVCNAMIHSVCFVQQGLISTLEAALQTVQKDFMEFLATARAVDQIAKNVIKIHALSVIILIS